MGRFSYVLQKIREGEFLDEPFKHLAVENFFAPDDFNEIISVNDIHVPHIANDEELIVALRERHFEPIDFPGTTSDLARYLSWHKDPSNGEHSNQETCEGFGVVFRWQPGEGKTILYELKDFFESEVFVETLAEKFGVQRVAVYPDWGIQKYLDGYEISPHPDIRQKAVTYMININPAENAEKLVFHTHYMKFVPERTYVAEYWKGNLKVERCWVPWDWCKTFKQQTKNNSAVFFSPGNNTLHAVKAVYDHLKTQRTQLYGNLWYNEKKHLPMPSWRELDVQIHGQGEIATESFLQKAIKFFSS